MMNNEDFCGTLNVTPTSKLTLRTEAHALRLSNASDLWYLTYAQNLALSEAVC
jgi:hypothetical protein